MFTHFYDFSFSFGFGLKLSFQDYNCMVRIDVLYYLLIAVKD